MTQAYNLAILANAVDTSGKLNVGTNATGTLPVANGGTGLTATPSNGQIDIGNGSGFTRTTISAGTGITVTNGAGSITIASSGGAGTVTSVATGNGLSGGTITTTGTLSIACPSFNTVGSYCFGGNYFNQTFSGGNNFSAGTSTNQVQPVWMRANGNGCSTPIYTVNRASDFGLSQLSGTWKLMSAINAGYSSEPSATLFCRVS